MKKLICILIAAAILLSSVTFVTNGSTPHGYTRGDATDNGEVDSKDVLTVRMYLAGMAEERDICAVAADADESGDISNKDVLLIRKYLAGTTDFDDNNVDGEYKVDRITAGGRNISRYTVVVTDTSNECMVYSAGELKKYIRGACGITLNISADEADIDGYKIKYLFDTEDTYGLGREGFHVEFDENGDLLLYCGSMRGPIYATYDILERFAGYRFLPEDIVYLDEAENADIPALTCYTETPGFEYRTVCEYGVTEFSAPKLRNNGQDGSCYTLAQARYGWSMGTLFLHAHSYAVAMAGWEHQYDGEYLLPFYMTQPCLTSEETYRKIIGYSTQLIEERDSWGQHLGETYTQISCSPNDNNDFCQCTNCKAIYAEECAVSGAVFRLSNRVAEYLEQLYPGIEIFTISYSDSIFPPKMTVPRENVCVMVCNGGCANHTYDRPEDCLNAGENPRLKQSMRNEDGEKYYVNTSNYLEVEGYKKWTEYTDRIYVWYYGINYTYNLSPCPDIFNYYNDFKFYAENGCKGVYSDGFGSENVSFENLKAYISAKLMWNPLMSEEEFNAVINDYLRVYFGGGWKYIRKAIEMENDCGDLNGCFTNNFDHPFNTYNENYIKENYEYLRELYMKAMEEAGTDEYARRVKRASLHIDFLGLSALFGEYYVNGAAEKKSVFTQRYTDLYNYIKTENVDAGPLDNFPKTPETVVNPMEWYYKGHNGYVGS